MSANMPGTGRRSRLGLPGVGVAGRSHRAYVYHRRMRGDGAVAGTIRVTVPEFLDDALRVVACREALLRFASEGGP